jgi:hypothetical protein
MDEGAIQLSHVFLYGPLVGITEHLLTLGPRTYLDFLQYNNKPHQLSSSNIARCFKGGIPMMTGVGLGHIGLFGCYYKSQQTSSSQLTQQMFYGACGRFLHDACIVPGDTLRQNMNIHNQSWKEAYTSILAQRGVRGLFVGLLPSLLYSVPCGAIEFALLHMCSRSDTLSQHPFVSGLIAGLVSNVLLSPLDTVRTHMQVCETSNPRSVGEIIQRVYQTQGWKAFYKGIPLRVCSVMLSYGLFKWCCEKLDVVDL